MRNNMSKLAILACFGALTVVSCNNNKKASASDGFTEGSPSASASASAGTAGAVDTVKIQNMAFNPASLTITKGTKVVWINKDMVAHDVTKVDNGQQTHLSDSIKTGQTYSMTPTASFNYICSIHPTMKGSITVK